MTDLSRRGFLSGLLSTAAAVAIAPVAADGVALFSTAHPVVGIDLCEASVEAALSEASFCYVEYGTSILFTVGRLLTPEQRAFSDRIKAENREWRERMAADILNNQFDDLEAFGT